MTTPGLHPALEPAASLTWERLEAFLNDRQVESERLDYKDQAVHSVLETAVAMANGRGGTIIVGVREDRGIPNTPGTWDGVSGDPQGTLNNFNWTYCTPPVRMQIFPVVNPTTAHQVVVIVVEPAIQPPHWHKDKGILIRVGDQDRLAPPALLEAWFAARSSGNPSENALRQRATAAVSYGSPGFLLNVWPTAVVPESRFGPNTDLDLDRLAVEVLPAGNWEGHPDGNEYVLEATRSDRYSLAAIAQQGYGRFQHIAVLEEPATSVDFVTSVDDLVLQYARRLAFAELALEGVCGAHPPYRVELVIAYAARWRVARPVASGDYADPILPSRSPFETHPRQEVQIVRRAASDGTIELVVGTLRRLGWRHFQSLVDHHTSTLPAATAALYDGIRSSTQEPPSSF
jgi:hypothetical protein